MPRPLRLAGQHHTFPVGNKERRSPLKALELGLPQVPHPCLTEVAEIQGCYPSYLPFMDTWGPALGQVLDPCALNCPGSMGSSVFWFLCW